MKFFDTCSLLLTDLNDEDFFIISSITLQEIEAIKVNKNKTEDLRYRARVVANWLNDNPDKYNTIIFTDKILKHSMKFNIEISNDAKIIATASYVKNDYDDFVFVTTDVNCSNIAKNIFLLPVSVTKEEVTDNYTGFKEVNMTDEEMAYFYENPTENIYNLLINQYLIIKNKRNEVIDKLVWVGNKYETVPYIKFQSQWFGEIKPYKNDIYQLLAMNSLCHNQATILGGPAGSGKTYLALGYLFSQLEHNKIDKIIIFCNPCGARNATKLGFYKGSVREKVLATQVGHVLSSKLGGMTEVERLLDEEILQIIPIVDARGYEVPPHCGVYILEAQNLTSDLLRLVLQRTAEDTKIIVDGDRAEQLDLDVYAADNGMRKMSKIFRGKDIFGQVDLQNIYRSKIASIAENMR